MPPREVRRGGHTHLRGGLEAITRRGAEVELPDGEGKLVGRDVTVAVAGARAHEASDDFFSRGLAVGGGARVDDVDELLLEMRSRCDRDESGRRVREGRRWHEMQRDTHGCM